MKLKCLIILSTIYLTNLSFSQVKRLTINWKEPRKITTEGKTILFPQFENLQYDNGKVIYFFKEKITSSSNHVKLMSTNFEKASAQDILYLGSLGFQLADSIDVSYGIRKDRGEANFVVSVFPFFKLAGEVHKITELDFSFGQRDEQSISKDFVQESVLREGSGTWIKIGVQKDGIYKIDKTFLNNCGLELSSINPNSIHIFGNGSGQLPELNSIPRKDDLKNNAIYVSGEEDGVFDDSDFILFYGVGPHSWFSQGMNEFDQKRHLYSDQSFYFINVNSALPPERIQNITTPEPPISTDVTSYDFRDIYEKDLVNLVSGGQRWYGELFDSELEKTFNFSIPNIDTSALRIKISLATNSRSTTGTLQQYSILNQVIYESPLPAVGVDYVRSNKVFSMNAPPSTIPFKVKIQRNSPSTLTYLDRILLNTRRKLIFYGSQMGFRNLTMQAPGNIAKYIISSFPSGGFVWDVSNVNEPFFITGNNLGNTFSFFTENIYKEFIASSGTSYLTPTIIGQISNQNLHALSQPNLLIVSNVQFINQAERLADLHREEGKLVHVVTSEQIYNEFSGGAADPTAIRMMAKMFYDRGLQSNNLIFNSLLLFGDGTYDPKERVANNNNMILTYQMENSENHIEALVTDDYFGLLDDNESISAIDLMDIGVGRILASDQLQAKQQVDKIEHYIKNGSTIFNAANASCCLGSSNENTLGDWRNKFVQIADDEENGYFINFDTEPQYNSVKNQHFEMNCDKLYLDAYPQVVTAGGQRYPDVLNAITDRVQRGALIMNYVGHGGEVGLAEERVVTIPQINSWSNINSQHLFVSATCEFTKFDDPSRVSAGEWLSLNPFGGAIALMTTTRSVYFSVNTSTGQAFFSNVFERDLEGKPLSFGEIMRLTKNNVGSSNNKRSFTLIGDPALKIGLPRYKVVTDSINGYDPLSYVDTMKALSKVTVKGHLEDQDGNLMTTFTGKIMPSIYDKVKIQKTLAQDPESPEIAYELQRSIVYKGKATVTNGQFSFTFVVPKDISLTYGKGKISYYAENDLVDANGFDTNFRIGGINPNGINDELGPELLLYMNDYSFVDGSLTDNNPVLILKASDENGINTVGNGIGHDLTAVLDGEESKPIILNDFYSADLDNYQSGEARYQFLNLEPGPHTIQIKAWDVNNNSSTNDIRFVVQNRDEPLLTRVLNYPNPFTTSTSFMFEHNQSCSSLDVQVQIMTVSGKVVKTIQQTLPTEGFRIEGVYWDGLDDFGDQLAKGVYLYRIKVRTPDGITAEKAEKLAILR
ncbi:MAG: type IX secretion system sortase PorU [Bacteroidetes bacterium]|nr:type IX secretion system sortase PorU [Bacteroidota bacterium]